MIELKSRGEIDVMRQAGRVVAAALRAVRDHARVGVRLRELDEIARAVIDDAGARPSLPDYRPRWARAPFPGAVCCSVNDVIVRGVPDDTRLARGDLLSVECAAHVQGWHCAAAITVPLDPPGQDDLRLLKSARDALDDGIAAAVAEHRLGEVSRAIGIVARSGGFGVPTRVGGHGIGRDLHQDPFVANDGTAATDTPLRPGMVLVLGPILLAGGADDVRGSDDGWALRTGDESRAVHVARTVAITDTGPRVLTEL